MPVGPDPATRLVAFLFTDIEASTKLLQRVGQEEYAALLDTHRRLLVAAFARHGGIVVGTEGDSCFVVFDRPSAALHAAVDGQLALQEHEWPRTAAVRVRMGVHAGEALRVAGDYVGMAVHIAARVCEVAHGGQILTTSATAAIAGEVATTDLGSHDLKDVGRTQILQVDHPRLHADFPPVRTVVRPPHNLPVPGDEFVGRKGETEDVAEALRASRLVTLVGAGGTGKTRLAVEVARVVLPAFPDGVWFVPLAHASDGSQVMPLIASTLRVGTRAGEPLEVALDSHLADKTSLLVLDNCEHVVPAVGAVVARLLGTSGAIGFLATSRELLGVRGERACAVPPLAVCADDVGTECDAVELFLARAESAVPGFDPDAVDRRDVLELCRRLDGLPLAIELAAARLRVLSLEQVSERLDDRFRLLTGGRRADLPRQRTLEAVVAWSYDLLEERECHLFRRLSVFAGDFTLEAAEVVAAGDPIDACDVLDSLTVLVDKSLVSTVPDGARYRYRLLETLRQYGRDRLLEAGEAEPWRDRLVAWALALVERIEAAMRTPAQDVLLTAAIADRANLRLAFDWARDRGDDVSALRIAAAAPVALNGERRALLLELLERVQARGELDDLLAGRAWMAVANIGFETNAWDEASAAAARAACHFSSAGDDRQAAWAHYLEAHTAWGAGRLDVVDRLVTAAVDEFRSLGDDMGLGYALWLASLREPDLQRASTMSAEADVLLRLSEAPVGVAHNVEGRAIIALDLGALEDAARFAAEAVSSFSSRGSAGCTAHALEVAAAVAHRGGRPAARVWELLAASEELRKSSGQGRRPWEIRARHGALEQELGDRPAGGTRPLSLAAVAALALDALEPLAQEL